MPGNDNADRTVPPDHDPANPRVVAGYRLLRRIGEGGMSSVYLSYDVPGRRAVAVKLLADHLAAQAEFVNRFYREAHLSQKLHHPNIVQGLAQGYRPPTPPAVVNPPRSGICKARHLHVSNGRLWAVCQS